MLESSGETPMLIDTHAHVSSPEFADDLSAVLERGESAGVRHVICVGYDIATSRRAVELAEQDPRIFATVGVHPNSVAEEAEDWRRTVEHLAQHPRVVAIGETGLDYYRDFTPVADQQRALRWHLELADALGLPVVIHNRESDDDVTNELLRWSQTRASQSAPGILHSFCATEEMMARCAAAGFAISFSGMITFSNKSMAFMTDLVRQAPAEALLVETDSPYLAPTPFRGRRNEPGYTRLVAERVAEIRGLPVAEVEELTTANARRVFARMDVAALA
jgi:TatD DNase family protein